MMNWSQPSWHAFSHLTRANHTSRPFGLCQNLLWTRCSSSSDRDSINPRVSEDDMTNYENRDYEDEDGRLYELDALERDFERHGQDNGKDQESVG